MLDPVVLLNIPDCMEEDELRFCWALPAQFFPLERTTVDGGHGRRDLTVHQRRQRGIRIRIVVRRFRASDGHATA